MRHRRKSSAGQFTGLKLAVTVEPKSHVITNVKAHRGNSHDGSLVKDAVAEQKAVGLEPEELIGDTAYGGSASSSGSERSANKARPADA
jgi:hypothetical protein